LTLVEWWDQGLESAQRGLGSLDSDGLMTEVRQSSPPRAGRLPRQGQPQKSLLLRRPASLTIQLLATVRSSIGEP